VKAWAIGPGAIRLGIEALKARNDGERLPSEPIFMPHPISRFQRLPELSIRTPGVALGFYISRLWRFCKLVFELSTH
jgi:hypothetical protein